MKVIQNEEITLVIVQRTSMERQMYCGLTFHQEAVI